MRNTAPATESTPAPQVMSRLTFPRAAWNGVWISGVALLVYYALFRLPFSFPPHQRLMSASYAFGFNNGVAILAMTGMLGLVALLSLIRRRAAIELPISFPKKRAREAKRSERLAFAIAAACYTGLTLAMYMYNVRSAPALMWETRHLLHRTWLMDLYGLHPYTEVAAEYGPILTYAPSWMYWLLRPLGASHELAYFACHLLLNLAGLWCGWYVLSRAVMPPRARVVAFVLVAIAGFGPWMGVNGVLIRYLFPFAALLLGHRVIALMLSRLRFIAWWGGALASILLLLVGNILLSPEIGVAFALTWFGYAVLMSRRDLRILAVSLIAFAAAALLCWLFLPAAYYGTLIAVLGGGEQSAFIAGSAFALVYSHAVHPRAATLSRKR